MVKDKNTAGKKNIKVPKTNRAAQSTMVQDSCQKQYLPLLALIMTCALVFYPPFVQGLFFKQQTFMLHILTGITMLVVLILIWVKKDWTFISTPMDWALMAFVLAYFIALPGAVHPGEAFYGFLKVLNYFAIYWLLKWVIRDFNDIETIARVLLAAAVAVAAIGIMAALGWSSYPDAFDGLVINSTLQYSNTNAAFMTMAALIAVGLWTREKGSFLQLVYLISAALMTLVALAGLSKGAWLVFVVGALLYIVGMPGFYKLKAFYGLVLTFVSAQLAYTRFYPAIINKTPEAVQQLLPGLLAVIAGYLLWCLIYYFYKQKGVVLTSLLVIALLSLPIWFLTPQLLPEQSLVTVAEGLLDFESISFTSRSDMNRWAWEIVKDYPLNGTGAGGWNAIYHQYQDYQFFSTETHNYFMQLWVETGTIGFLAWMAVLAIIVYYLIYIKRSSDQNQWMLLWGLATALMALIAHSLIDFDLSIPAIVICCWTIIAVLNKAFVLYTDNKSRFQPANWLQITGGLLIVLTTGTLLLTGGPFYAAYRQAAQGNTAMQKITAASTQSQNKVHYDQAVKHYEQAVKLDSFSAEYRAELAYLYAAAYGLQESRPDGSVHSTREGILDLITEANELKRYDIKIKNRLIDSSYRIKDIAATIRLAEEVIDANPYDEKAYILLSNLLTSAMSSYQKADDQIRAKECARQLVAIEAQIERQKNKIINHGGVPALPILAPESQKQIQQAKEYLQR